MGWPPTRIFLSFNCVWFSCFFCDAFTKDGNGALLWHVCCCIDSCTYERLDLHKWVLESQASSAGGRFCPKSGSTCVGCSVQICMSMCLLRANASVHIMMWAPGAPKIWLLECQSGLANSRSCLDFWRQLCRLFVSNIDFHMFAQGANFCTYYGVRTQGSTSVSLRVST